MNGKKDRGLGVKWDRPGRPEEEKKYRVHTYNKSVSFLKCAGLINAVLRLQIKA